MRQEFKVSLLKSETGQMNPHRYYGIQQVPKESFSAECGTAKRHANCAAHVSQRMRRLDHFVRLRKGHRCKCMLRSDITMRQNLSKDVVNGWGHRRAPAGMEN